MIIKRREFLIGALTVATSVVAPKILFGSEDEYYERHRSEEYEHHKKKTYNRLTNRENPSVMEQKHVPAVEAPSEVKKNQWFDIKVRVGFMKEHPSTPEHWITKIALLVNGQKVAKMEYPKGGVAPSEATFRIRLQEDATIEAVEHCNLHGTWISEPVKVKVM